MSAGAEIMLIGALAAAACALPGCLLVLRRMSLMSDAIGHSILLGIALGYLIAHDIGSPLLILGAAAVGLLTVALTELIIAARQVKEDAAIGLVFPVLFSIGVILITRYAGQVHLDTDAVLLGMIEFAPFDRVLAGGYDLGPRAAWILGAILALNAAFIGLLYKELKLSTFDPVLAAAAGFVPGALSYALMALVSVTAVGAFDAVGSILVVALMIAPPATAYLLTDRLGAMLLLSVGIGAAAAVLGYGAARWLDASIAGSMAVACGVLFTAALLLAPERGLLSQALLRRRQKWEFAAHMLAIHLLQHEGTPAEQTESAVRHMGEGLRWSAQFAGGVIAHALDGGLITREAEQLALTPLGRETARDIVSRS